MRKDLTLKEIDALAHEMAEMALCGALDLQPDLARIIARWLAQQSPENLVRLATDFYGWPAARPYTTNRSSTNDKKIGYRV